MKEIIFTCPKCEQNYETKHLPQAVKECPACGWKPKKN